MTEMQRFIDAKSRREQADKEMIDLAPAVFEAGIRDLFDRYPQLTDISFTGYTPYFNDGDACTYSCNAEYPSINRYGSDAKNLVDKADEDREGEGEGKTWWEEVSSYKEPAADASWEKKAAYEFSQLAIELGDDMFLSMFDDHARVIVTKNKTVVQRYDHS